MSRRLVLTSLLLLATCATSHAQGDSEFYLAPKTPAEFWRATRFEIRTGSYERAAGLIKQILEKKPDEKTLFEITENPGPAGEPGITPFLKLRNIPRWSVNPKLDKEAKENVEVLIEMVSKAISNELKNEDRIKRFIKALVGEREEAAYAIKELRRSGKSVVPILCSILSGKPEEDARSAIFQAIPLLGDETIPGFVAYLSIAEPADQVELISCFQKRGDFRLMRELAQSDPVPTLLYQWGNPNNADSVRLAGLKGVTLWTLKDPTQSNKLELRTPVGQLIATAKDYLDGKANLGTSTGNADGVPTFNIWVPDGKTVKEIQLSKVAAFEYYGLRSARWALDLQPDNAIAQEIFLSIAIEAQAYRTGGTLPLYKTAPQLNAVLSTAPYDLLVDLLEKAIIFKKSATVLAVVRTLGDRAEAKAAKSNEIKVDGEKTRFRPSVLVKALEYPDPRVKFAAADALLKIPGEPTHGRTDEIMKLLISTLTADPPAGAKQKALYADPDPVRGEGITTVLQQAGFDTEIATTGKQLIRRIQESNDVDLIVVDRHIVNPMLTDLLPQLRADIRGKTIPMFVVASPEGITPVNLLTILTRLATVVSVEDLQDHPYIELPRNEEELKKIKFFFDEMSTIVNGRYTSQVKRMTEVVREAGFTIDEQMQNRIAYLTLQTIPTPAMDNFAKNLFSEERLVTFKLLPPGVAEELAPYKTAVAKNRIAIDPPPSKSETEKILKLMLLTNREESKIENVRLPRMNAQWDLFWSKDVPRLPAIVSVRHPDIEMVVAKKIHGYNRVRVLPAVFTTQGLQEELVQLVDPKSSMVTPEEKKENAATALNWLRKIARGEVLGYRILQAEVAIRSALNSDELALVAIDTISRMPSKMGQQDLATIATTDTRPAPIRIAASEGLVRSVQSYGKFVTPAQVDSLIVSAKAAADLDLKAKLNYTIGVLKPDGKVTGGLLKGYTPELNPPALKENNAEPKDAPKADPKEPKEPEKM